MNKYLLKLFSKIGAIGWDVKPGEKDLTKLLRSIVLSVLGDAGDKSVIEEAKKRFESYKADKKSVPNDLLGVVLKLVMRNGGQAEYDKMVQFYKHDTAQPEEKIRFLRTIGLSKDIELIKKAIDIAFSDAVRSQDVYILLHATATTSAGHDYTWNYIKSHWEAVLEKVGGGNFMLARVVANLTQTFNTKERAHEVEEFFKTRTLPAIERTVPQCLESIQANATFLQKNLQETTAWLKEHA